MFYACSMYCYCHATVSLPPADFKSILSCCRHLVSQTQPFCFSVADILFFSSLLIRVIWPAPVEYETFSFRNTIHIVNEQSWTSIVEDNFNTALIFCNCQNIDQYRDNECMQVNINYNMWKEDFYRLKLGRKMTRKDKLTQKRHT